MAFDPDVFAEQVAALRIAAEASLEGRQGGWYRQDSLARVLSLPIDANFMSQANPVLILQILTVLDEMQEQADDMACRLVDAAEGIRQAAHALDLSPALLDEMEGSPEDAADALESYEAMGQGGAVSDHWGGDVSAHWGTDADGFMPASKRPAEPGVYEAEPEGGGAAAALFAYFDGKAWGRFAFKAGEARTVFVLSGPATNQRTRWRPPAIAV